LVEEVVSGDGCESSWLAPWPANRDCSEPIIAISDVMRSQCLARQSRPDSTSYVPIWPPPFPTPSCLVLLVLPLLGHHLRKPPLSIDGTVLEKLIARYGIPLPSVLFLYLPGTPRIKVTEYSLGLYASISELSDSVLSTSSALWPSARARKGTPC